MAYNIGLGEVGGATPMLATWLISLTGNKNSLAAMVFGVAVVGVAGAAWMKDRSREKLL